MLRRSSIMLAAGALLTAFASGLPGAGNALALSRLSPRAVAESGKGAQTTVFDGRFIWGPDHAYPAGLRQVQGPPAPASFEQAMASRLDYSNGMPHLGPKSIPSSWVTKTSLAGIRSFTVNGSRYLVPSWDQGRTILLLPIDTGIVWAVEDPSSGPSSPVIFRNNRFYPNPLATRGATPLYFTPYHSGGGSLALSALLIGNVPHRWPALNGPVAASAWVGWIPAGKVLPPSSAAVTAHTVYYRVSGASEVVARESASTSKLPGWPSVFLRSVGGLQAGREPSIAGISSLARTEGGFVLSVRLTDPNYGMAAGMVEADYYWSDRLRKWTPLTQIYEDQTLVSFVDVGSRAVYWEQALPTPGGNGSSLDVIQARFDPVTRAIHTVWLGNWFYGASFVDGASWLIRSPQAHHWTVYTP